MRALRAAAVAALAVTTSACSLWSRDDRGFQPVAAPRVALAAGGLDAPVRLGLLVSATSPAGEGAELLGPAAGVRIAEYRFAQGGVDVTVDVHDDKGTADGALAGVRAMVEDGVAGIVAATTGRHLDEALRAAAASNVPVLLPYERRDVPGASSAWYTGPDAGAVRDRLRALVSEHGMERLFVLHGEGARAEVTGLPAVRTAAIRPGQSAAAVVEPVLAAAARDEIETVVIAASATTQAALVAEIQGRAPDVELVLSPAALAPAFGNGLAERMAKDGSATPSGRFLTVGPGSVDAATYANDERARTMAAFLAANRLAARVPDVTALTHAVAFGEEGAATADPAAHDAVVALVRAAERAKSTDAADVAAALGTLTLGPADGLAGPPLDLTKRRAFAPEHLFALASTTEDAGTRAGVAEERPALRWFVLPDGG